VDHLDGAVVTPKRKRDVIDGIARLDLRQQRPVVGGVGGGAIEGGVDLGEESWFGSDGMKDMERRRGWLGVAIANVLSIGMSAS
jgi:hypothetical protein